MKHPTSFIALTVGVALLTGCGHAVQTSSGADYLAGYTEPHPPATPPPPGWQAANAGETWGPTSVDEEVRLVAGVEPTLEFPARIGLAYIENGRLSAVPASHAEAWLGAAADLGPAFGSFVPVSPLIAGLAETSLPAADVATQRRGSPLMNTIRQIRLGAARQHLDAVIVYETSGRAETRATPLSILNLTLIGMALVPASHVSGEGHAQAILLDVRNGYPYLHASATGDSATMATYSNSREVRRETSVDASDQAVVALISEIKAGFVGLRDQLARNTN